MKTNLYIPRSYRNIVKNKNLFQFVVQQGESDLLIMTEYDLSIQAGKLLSRLRDDITSYIEYDNKFLTSLKPIEVSDSAPDIVKDMAFSTNKVNVGPMAAVAGAISEFIARDLFQFSNEVIVENGGDNFIINQNFVIVGIYAGDSPLSMKIGIEIEPQSQGIAVCTSSGTVGHSLSFGNADAVTVIAKSGSFADAAATALCNMVKSEKDIEKTIEFARTISEILGLIIIVKDRIGVIGEKFKLIPITD